MTTTTPTRERQTTSTEDLMEIFNRRIVPAEDPDAEELRLLAMEIIMFDPALAKQLVRAGVDKMLKESPTASG